jgi:hypothetical protein
MVWIFQIFSIVSKIHLCGSYKFQDIIHIKSFFYKQ